MAGSFCVIWASARRQTESMISSLVAVAVASDVVILRRGAVLQGAHKGVLSRYWDVQEAQIDADSGGLTIATGFGLTGDVKRGVFMKFGSLDLALSPQTRIEEATLRIKLTDPTKSAISGVRLVKRPWMWPGVSVLSKRIQTPAAGKEVPFAPGVTWTHAGGDTGKWQVPGALGAEDSQKLDAAVKVDGDTVEISGLGATFQYLKTHEGENFGLLIESSGRSEFWSSISPTDQPELVLKVSAGQASEADAWVSNVNGEIILHSNVGVSNVKTFFGAGRISSSNVTPPSKAVPLKLDERSGSKDRRNGIYRIVATSATGEQLPPILIDPAAPWKQVSPAAARAWNVNAVDASPYSFAPFGAGTYINPAVRESSMDPLGEFFKEAASDDNRSDIALLNRLVPPARPTDNPLFKQLARPEAGPLTLFQVDRLLHPEVKYPKVLILRAVSPAGVPLPGAKLKFAGQSEAMADKNGYIFPQALPDGWSGKIRVEGEVNGVRDGFDFHSAQISNLYARGMVQAASLEIPLNAPTSPISREMNLVSGKPVKDSAGSFPAQLIGLTDDSDLTTFTLAPGAWVEVDLGRDRFLGCFKAKGKLPESFGVSVYGTTEKPEQAQGWLRESSLEERRANYPSGEAETETYYPMPMGGRYLRITNFGKTPAVFKGIQVFAAKREG